MWFVIRLFSNVLIVSIAVNIMEDWPYQSRPHSPIFHWSSNFQALALSQAPQLLLSRMRSSLSFSFRASSHVSHSRGMVSCSLVFSGSFGHLPTRPHCQVVSQKGPSTLWHFLLVHSTVQVAQVHMLACGISTRAYVELTYALCLLS